MRGKVAFRLFAFRGGRITPAYAGKRICVGSFVHRMQDHPRLCGEKDLETYIAYFNWGSPPPMRGKVLDGAGNTAASRITPAYAGKSIENELFAGNEQDRPRLCGEKIMFFLPFSFEQGSPPPMRGKGCAFGNSRYRLRITPAYAGKRFPVRLKR